MLPSCVTFMAHIMEKVRFFFNAWLLHRAYYGAFKMGPGILLLRRHFGGQVRLQVASWPPAWPPVGLQQGPVPACCACCPLNFAVISHTQSAPSVFPLSSPQVGLAGEAPGLFGLLNADLAVGAVAGATAILSFGTLTPHLAAALGRRGGRATVAALLLASLGAAGWASVRYARPFRCAGCDGSTGTAGAVLLSCGLKNKTVWVVCILSLGWMQRYITAGSSVASQLEAEVHHSWMQGTTQQLDPPFCVPAATTTRSACWCSTSTSKAAMAPSLRAS